jgi:hypothetical protein
MKAKDFMRKFRYFLFIPRRVTRVPKNHESVISDLFCIRDDANWQTFFELLDVVSLIEGISGEHPNEGVTMFFFDKNGNTVSEKFVPFGSNARKTIIIDKDFIGTSTASTFAVFHQPSISQEILKGSYLAERGYCGYKRIDTPIRGYVHGNLDSVAYSNEGLEFLGNQGLLSRYYQVQHPLRGDAEYEFFLTNPSKRKATATFQIWSEKTGWRNHQRFTLPPAGCCLSRVKSVSSKVQFVRVKSRFYLGRPVVFRNQAHSFDVFHG